VLGSKAPGDGVEIETAVRSGIFDVGAEKETKEVVLGEKNGQAYLGIGINQGRGGGSFAVTRQVGYILFSGAGTTNPSIYYESSIGNFGWFVYYLLWWTFFINALLAMFNMLPLGPLDGGKFLQLGVAKITGSEKLGKSSYLVMTWLLLALLAAMMIRWAISFI